MEKKPHKKEELMLANSVLKLAEALLKVCYSHIYTPCPCVLCLVGLRILEFLYCNSAFVANVHTANKITYFHLFNLLMQFIDLLYNKSMNFI